MRCACLLNTLMMRAITCARYSSVRLIETTNVLYEHGGSMMVYNDCFVSMFCCCFSTAHVTASMFESAGFRPLGCSLFLSFNELNISAMIALRFWYVVIDSFIQGAPNGASCYCIPTVGWCISLFKVNNTEVEARNTASTTCR